MTRMVNCVKLNKELEGLAIPPYPGDLGKRIWKEISKDGWAEWMKHQTILINEYRLSPMNAKDRKYLEEEMDKFLFGEGSDTPDAFKQK